MTRAEACLRAERRARTLPGRTLPRVERRGARPAEVAEYSVNAREHRHPGARDGGARRHACATAARTRAAWSGSDLHWPVSTDLLGTPLVESAAEGGDAPIKVQQDRKKLMEGHFNISITKRVSLENSTDLGRGAAPELKSVEFLSETLLVVEQIDIHTNFTAQTNVVPLSEHHPCVI